MHEFAQFSNIPKESIMYIGKDVLPIYWNNNNDLQKVITISSANQQLLVNEKKRIEAIDRIVEQLLVERKTIMKNVLVITKFMNNSDDFGRIVEMAKTETSKFIAQ